MKIKIEPPIGRRGDSLEKELIGLTNISLRGCEEGHGPRFDHQVTEVPTNHPHISSLLKSEFKA
ncbi:MAG: hypothetical protein DRJ31_04785 [Candidatus Methanomethylicota archaeon]|uniref:Uncharacterized protein n=1 Tax=Thermoproteota archaeon TaxID=2056631 RepID=A0A497ERF2_9CREN|nr:MAG: hypothetical protein DRJ31_04785 [Candidatus Verstraetearchaeota archaeon]RLE50623.1 MAG: hypothetical protein DRJ33_07280 [Candidatus Verstraetearchaeota archaeon]